MAEYSIVIAGFGGQGLLFAGKVLAYAGLMEGREVSWLPSYGPEMRGGTANCSVILSDEPVGSPIVDHPTVLMVMNGPSLEKFEPAVAPGGIIFVDDSLVPKAVQRTDVTVIRIPATGMAAEKKAAGLANMILLGALVEKTGCVTWEGVESGLRKVVPARKADMIGLNLEALAAGKACVAG